MQLKQGCVISAKDFPLRLAHHAPVLHLHGDNRTGDYRHECEHGADRQRGHAGDRLPHGAAHRQHAADAHQRAAYRVIDKITE